MNRLLTTAMAAIFLMAGVFGQDADNRSREAFMKRLYLSTSDDPMAILKVKTMNDFELQAPQVKKSKKKASMATGSLVDSSYSYQWDAVAQDWKSVANTKEVNSYVNYNITSYFQYNWNAQNITWDANSKINYEYNSENKIARITQENFLQDNNGNFNWINTYQYTYGYNALGQKTNYLSLFWNSNDSAWENNWQHLFTYNTDGDLVEILEQNWDLGAINWYNSYQYKYEFDENGFNTKYSFLAWESDLNEWVNKNQTLFQFRPDGQVSNNIVQNWDVLNNNWINNVQCNYFYNTSNKVESTLTQRWVDSTKTWINSKQEQYEYDAQENNTSILNQVWSESLSTWNTWMQTLNEYDAYGFKTSYATKAWSIKTNNWKSGTKTDYFLSIYEYTNLKQTINENNIYPNPCSSILNVRIQKNQPYLMYDISGKCVKYGYLKTITGNTIDVSNLKTGIYLFSTFNSNGVEEKVKIIKE